MGAREVIKILSKDKDKWFTIYEIEEKISNIGRVAISNSLKRLYNHDEILRKKGDYAVRCYIYKYNIQEKKYNESNNI